MFSELHKQFQGSGSERNIAIYLEKAGFKPPFAASIARNYKSNLGLMGGKAVTTSDPKEGSFELPVLADTQATAAMRHHVMRAEPGRVAVTGGDSAGVIRSEAIGTAAAPFRIVMNGDKLHIEADLDLKTLQVFKQVLNKYEDTLKILSAFDVDHPLKDLDKVSMDTVTEVRDVVDKSGY